jgi:NADH-quinone oxidoreductase subunit G
VGALTDKTFRFKNRVWFTKPVDAHRDCDKCCGKVTLWQRGDDVLRVTARKDEWGEVQSYDGKPGWICNTCRFDKKKASDWVIDGVSNINRHSVIAQNKYPGLMMPKETIANVMGGKAPQLLMDIHNVSDVNTVKIADLPGAATSKNFEKKEQE